MFKDNPTNCKYLLSRFVIVPLLCIVSLATSATHLAKPCFLTGDSIKNVTNVPTVTHHLYRGWEDGAST